MAAPIPAPLPPWARWLIQVLPLVSAGVQASLDYIGDMEHTAAVSPDEWRRYVYHFHDPSNIDQADVAVTTFDIVHVTGGGIDSSWTEGDYTTVDGQLDALIAAWCTHMCSFFQVFRCAVYRI